MTPEPDPLALRYGTHRPVRRIVLVAASVTLVVVSLGWLGWTVWFYSTPQIQSSLVGFEIDGPHVARAEVEVLLRDRNVEGSCVVQAIAEDHVVVGELSFTVPGPDVDGTGAVTRTVRTERMADSVDLVGCTAPDQPRPR